MLRSDPTVLALGVALMGALATFGPANFPLNYFQQQVAEIRERTGLVTSEDVETLVQGYEVRCDDSFGRSVDYLFYSQNISPGVFGSGALVIRVLYRGILSPEVDQITLWNIRDSSGRMVCASRSMPSAKGPPRISGRRQST